MPRLIMYSKPNCKPCAEAKMLFKLKGITYEEKPLIDHLELLIAKGFRSAPVFQIDDIFTQDKAKAVKLYG